MDEQGTVIGVCPHCKRAVGALMKNGAPYAVEHRCRYTVPPPEVSPPATPEEDRG